MKCPISDLTPQGSDQQAARVNFDRDGCKQVHWGADRLAIE
jgi:hypothetical protein